MIRSCGDDDLRREVADDRLLARRERRLQGDWDAPGEFLDSEHEASEAQRWAEQEEAERLEAEAEARELAEEAWLLGDRP